MLLDILDRIAIAVGFLLVLCVLPAAIMLWMFLVWSFLP